MHKLMTLAGSVVIGAATWFLLYVILDYSLGTAFIAGGVALAAIALIPILASARAGAAAVTAPVTTGGILLGLGAFVILSVVLSVTMWIDVVVALGLAGAYDALLALARAAAPGRDPAAAERTTAPAPPAERMRPATPIANGFSTHEPVGTAR